MADSVSDDDRKKIEAGILVALRLIYLGRAREALDRLGLIDQEATIPADAEASLAAFAAERAGYIQTGINQRLNGLSGAEYDQALREIQQHNDQWLKPFLSSTASHQGLVDTYQNTPGQDSGKSAAEETLWVWTQFTDNPDDCAEAMGISPAPLAEIQEAAGVDMPPAHDKCKCTLFPQ